MPRRARKETAIWLISSFPSSADADSLLSPPGRTRTLYSLLFHQDHDRADGESTSSAPTAPSGGAAFSQLTAPTVSLPPQPVTATSPTTVAPAGTAGTAASAASAAPTATAAATVGGSSARAAPGPDPAEDVTVEAMLAVDGVDKERVGVAVLPTSVPAAREEAEAAVAAAAAVAPGGGGRGWTACWSE